MCTPSPCQDAFCITVAKLACFGNPLLLLSVCLTPNSWGSNWGLRGSFRIAYGSAYVMQPGYTYALQFNRGSMADRAASIRQRLAPDLAGDPSQQSCIMYNPKQAQRLVKLTDELTILATSALTVALRLRKQDILADVITSNLGFVRSLAATGRGPFRLCGWTAQLLSSVTGIPLPSPPPAMPASPSPGLRSLSPSPSPSTVPNPSASPSPGRALASGKRRA
jgi:hypothetical protein